jgi:hypothetical protein
MAAVLLSNFGTSLAYNGAKRALRKAVVMQVDNARDTANEASAAGQPFVPRTERAVIRAGR